MSKLNLIDFAESVKDRLSWKKFSEKNTTEVTDMEKAAGDLKVAVTNAAEGDKTLKSLTVPFQTKLNKLQKAATLGKDGWVAKEGVKEDVFNLAKEKYEKASAKLEDFLSGKEKIGEHGVSPELQKTFETAKEKTSKIRSQFDGMFSMAKQEGFVDAVKNNYQTIVGKIEAPMVKRVSMGAGTVACGVAIGDSLLRSKNKEGEARSGTDRVLEFILAGGAGAALLASGHAR